MAEALEMENWEIDEIGGPVYQRLEPTAIVKPVRMKVLEVMRKETKWGVRYDFVGMDSAGFDIGFSSWNIVSKHKIKPNDLIDKWVLIERHNDKRFRITPE